MSENNNSQPPVEAADWSAPESPGFLLWNLENLWQREQRRALEPFDLTIVQFLLLSGLSETGRNDGPVSQIVLARKCRTDPMMTSQVVRTLARAGLVERTRDRTDKRAFAVRLTDSGRERQQAAEATVRTLEHRFFAALGSETPVFADALRLLGGERPRRRVQAESRNA